MSGWRRITPVALQGASSRILLEGPAVPPAPWIAGIGTAQLSFDPQPAQGFLDPPQPAVVAVECQQATACSRNLRSLAARRRAGIQHPHPGLHLKRGHRSLRGDVLHRERTFGKAGQTRGVASAAKGEGVALKPQDFGAGFGEPQKQLLATVPVHAQSEPQRRRLQVGLHDRVVVLRPIGAKVREQPVRMGARGFLRGSQCRQLRALAQEASQHRVDESDQTRKAEQARRLAARSHCRMFGQAQLFELSEADMQQELHAPRLLRQRFVQ
jgi:hypothetical protein